MTKQDVFDTVAKHLLTQKARSEDNHGEPYYRGQHNLKCAVGVLIHDDVYSPNLEGRAAFDDRVASALVASGVTRESLVLVNKLQELHDDHPVEAWPILLESVAVANGLNTLVLGGAA